MCGRPPEPGQDVVTLLFVADLDHVLKTVFLLLGPDSLKQSRAVCSQWDEYICDRLWGARYAGLWGYVRHFLAGQAGWRWKTS